mmetsp:Transcript_7793/g.16273  ORF Transcript_7793/g.16273 Transcript_7793/m.16273 type:complete len:144 (-) Transcript_7793:91-522(-)
MSTEEEVTVPPSPSSPTSPLNQIILLHGGLNGGSTAAQAGNTRRCIDLLIAKKVKYRDVDGSDSEQKEERDSLFQISGVRGNYPQLFVSVSSSPPTPPEFLGAWEKIEEMNELNDLPREVLEANPDIVTLDMVFEECEKVIEG